MKTIISMTCLFFIPYLCLGQEIEEPEVESEESESESVQEQSPVVAAGWCSIDLSRKKQVESVDGPDDGEETEEIVNDDNESSTGCDVGVGAALYRKGRFFVAGVLGSRTLGFGAGWTAFKNERMVVAVALGIIAPYDRSGVYAGDAAPAIGCTLGFGGKD